jgi:hypothetical protein
MLAYKNSVYKNGRMDTVKFIIYLCLVKDFQQRGPKSSEWEAQWENLSWPNLKH